ncbi:transketolase family protein [Patescibacteria group bacterium]
MNKPEPQATRDGFSKGLVQAAQQDDSLVVLTADLTDSTRVGEFKKLFPNRFFNVGVAEQNLAGIAAGLALSGKTPFITSYSVFSPGRNWEQIRISICYQNTNVKIIGHHSGVHTGPDGATHQGLEDIAITRCLPNLTVISPCDALEAAKATLAIAKHQGPAYLRLTRNKTPLITSQNTEFEIGKANILQSGTDVTIVGTGPLLSQALKAAEKLLGEKIKAEVINCHTIKPLDTKTILQSVKKTHCLVTVEDHQIMGGLGSVIVESLAQEYAAPLTEMIGIKDKFGQSGTPEELWKQYHLDADSIIKAVKKVITRKRRL